MSMSVSKTHSQQAMLSNNYRSRMATFENTNDLTAACKCSKHIFAAGAHGIHNLPCATKLRLWMGYRS